MGARHRSTPRQIARMVDEVGEAGLQLHEGNPAHELVIGALDYALRPDVHERRIPSFGAIVDPTMPEDSWGAATNLTIDVRQARANGSRPLEASHLYADGISSWMLLRADGNHAGVVLDRPSGSERDLVVLAKAMGATLVQRHPSGQVRVVGSHGVLRFDGMRWHHEPPVWTWIDTLTAFPGDGKVMAMLVAFALHDLGARGIGATLIYRPDDTPLTNYESRLPCPPPLNILHPTDLAPLRHALSQIDGATFIDSDGLVRQIGVRLIASDDAESNVDGLKGMRHTSARKYSFDDPKATVIVVSEDGPVTLLRGGEIIGASPVDPEDDDTAEIEPTA